MIPMGIQTDTKKGIFSSITTQDKQNMEYKHGVIGM
jgi:hypothetical protein